MKVPERVVHGSCASGRHVPCRLWRLALRAACWAVQEGARLVLRDRGEGGAAGAGIVRGLHLGAGPLPEADRSPAVVPPSQAAAATSARDQ